MSKTLSDWYTPINKEKYVGTKTPRYRSTWELTFMRTCDMRPDIVQWASEPVHIPYINPFTGKHTFYIPDFFVSYIDKNGKQHSDIIEIKPKKEISEKYAKSERDKMRVVLNKFKWKAAVAWCNNRGLRFVVMCEDNIFNNEKRKK